ncbi:hypothetical protein [Erythrobacter colymbi]|nr:hypothetical protein [Erythrobacter colymbi]
MAQPDSTSIANAIAAVLHHVTAAILPTEALHFNDFGKLNRA